MKRIFIDESGGGRHFENKCTYGEDSESSLYVRCAFGPDDSQSCTPDCAACIQRGERVFCVRNGIDREFEIGSIEEIPV